MNPTTAELQPGNRLNHQSWLQVIMILLAVLMFSLETPTAHAATHKLRIQDPTLAKELVERGGKVLGDYGNVSCVSMI